MAKQLQPEWTFKWEAFEETRDFPLTVKMVRDAKAMAAPHSHDFFELLLVVSGTGLYETPSGEYQLKPGDIFLLLPGQVHGFSRQHHLTVYNILWKSAESCIDLQEIENLPGYHLYPTPGTAHDSSVISIWTGNSWHSHSLSSNVFTMRFKHAGAVTDFSPALFWRNFLS